MARIRTIKPEFFTSGDILKLSPLARLLYIALWCEADRDGRMKWDTETLKYRYLPKESENNQINSLIEELQAIDLVVIYEVGNKVYAEIPTFSEHQVINNRETVSAIPQRVKDASPRVKAEGKEGREGKGRKEGKEHVPGDAEDASGNPEKQDCPHQEIIALYHEVLPMCPRIRDWTPARAVQLRARWNEDEMRQNLDYWKRFFEYVASCDFLVGKAGKSPFFADLEWMTKAGNFTKIREEKYANKGAL